MPKEKFDPEQNKINWSGETAEKKEEKEKSTPEKKPLILEEKNTNKAVTTQKKTTDDLLECPDCSGGDPFCFRAGTRHYAHPPKPGK